MRGKGQREKGIFGRRGARKGSQRRMAGRGGRGCYKLWAVMMRAGKTALDLKGCSRLHEKLGYGGLYSCHKSWGHSPNQADEIPSLLDFTFQWERQAINSELMIK